MTNITRYLQNNQFIYQYGGSSASDASDTDETGSVSGSSDIQGVSSSSGSSGTSGTPSCRPHPAPSRIPHAPDTPLLPLPSAARALQSLPFCARALPSLWRSGMPKHAPAFPPLRSGHRNPAAVSASVLLPA